MADLGEAFNTLKFYKKPFQNIDYFWFSGARNTDCPIQSFPYIMSLSQVAAVTADPNILKLHDFCIMNWAQENDPDANPATGHLSESGHKKFAELLLEQLNQP